MSKGRLADSVGGAPFFVFKFLMLKAPNYRKVGQVNTFTCSTCRHGGQRPICATYGYQIAKGMRCDHYRPQPTAVNATRSALKHAVHDQRSHGYRYGKNFRLRHARKWNKQDIWSDYKARARQKYGTVGAKTKRKLRAQGVNVPKPKRTVKKLAVKQLDIKQVQKRTAVPTFKSKKQATAWVRSQGLIRGVDFGKMSLESIQETVQSLSDHMTMFPKLKERLVWVGSNQAFNRMKKKEIEADAYKRYRANGYDDVTARKWAKRAASRAVGKTPGRAYAMAYQQDGAITFNEKHSKNARSMRVSLARDVKSGWHPPGTASIKAVMDHELGHQLDFLLGITKSRYAMSPSMAGTRMTSVLSNLRKQGSFSDLISRYAATNHREVIAEAWAEYMNNPNPRPAAKAIGEFILSEYQRQYGDLGVTQKEVAMLTVTKEANGDLRWWLLSGSAFEDRDGDIVSTAALKQASGQGWGNYGPLRWWHVRSKSGKGVDLGDCDFQYLHGRVLIESGTFRSEKAAQFVKRYASRLKVSLGFKHPLSEPVFDPQTNRNVFNHVYIFERSIMPTGFQSNLVTAVAVT